MEVRNSQSSKMLKCSVCQTETRAVYIKHAACEHYACTECVYSSLRAVDFHPSGTQCQICEDYGKRCPTCRITYTDTCPRNSHNCLDDEGVFEV